MKKSAPTTPTRRHTVLEDFSILTKKRPEKGLTFFFKRAKGRSSSGRISCRHKGGGVKKLYRIVEFGQKYLNIPSKVIAIEYDPFRTSFIALLEYANKEKGYVIAWQDVKIGDEVIVSEKCDIKPGNRMKLNNILVGTQVYNIELQPGRGGIMIKSAGSSAVILACENGFVNLKMPSGEIRKINGECFATVGAVSRPEHKYVKLGKAGRTRWLGKRPTVRGKVMNPCDHPHGGGEGRQPLGMSCPKTPWGKLAKGVKTRKRRYTDKYILQRRKSKQNKQ
ncbi:MAG TPA: 50S ribosomal protein L2 [Candidatus Pacearchaeota archaeon]|nr:50S ribosomal protein L2 [Candidatus Pacearchaeota archaeon]HQI74396.1 50S ribosomal protein L2 [Candidatus Pacearchaeota archaeon]